LEENGVAIWAELTRLSIEIEEIKKTLAELPLKLKEEVLLLIPDVIGSVMMQHAVNQKITSEFYKKHPEFKNHGKIVASVIGELDSKYPDLPYDKLTEKAAPIIAERIKVGESLDMTSVSDTPQLNVGVAAGERSSSADSNGAL